MILTLLSAIVWGSSAKHSRGQKVGLDHILEDEDGGLLPFGCSFEALTTHSLSGAYFEEVEPGSFVLYVTPSTLHVPKRSLFYQIQK